MNPRTGKRVLIVLLVVMALVATRTGYIFYQRSRPMKRREAAPAANAYQPGVDDYVTSPKIFPYDLKSAAKEMVGKTVWVRVGNVVPYYRYNAGSADLVHKAGLLPPLEKLQIKDVVLQRAPAALAPGQVAIVQKKVLAIVERPEQSGDSAVVVGSNINDNFEFIANDIFFFANPHELYKHWPADVWTAIDQHQAKKGMNELQVGFALGAVSGASSGDYGNRMVQFRSGAGLVNVTFENNRAVTIVENKE